MLRAIHDEHVSVLVTVPRLIESLSDQIERDLAGAGKLDKFRREFAAAAKEHFLRRWWRFRKHSQPPRLEILGDCLGRGGPPGGGGNFWSRLGYAVIQGYGLTETTSLVSLNHPFRLGRRSIGKALPGLEIKLAEDGEILVRGENVAQGYWKDSRVAPVLDEDGWFHTGDIAGRDSAGNYYFKGRRKNVIVTPEGLNIYPEDLEAELRKDPGVRDCVVVGLDRNGNAEPCAVLLLRDSSSDRAGQMQPKSFAARTPGSLRSSRFGDGWFGPARIFRARRLKSRAGADSTEAAEVSIGRRKSPVRSIQAESRRRIARANRARAPRIAENGAQILQLSSIERVELLSALEDRYQVDLSETEFTKAETVADLEHLLQHPGRALRLSITIRAGRRAGRSGSFARLR